MIKISVWTMTEEHILEIETNDEPRYRYWEHCCLSTVIKEIEKQFGWDRYKLQIFNGNGEPIYDMLNGCHKERPRLTVKEAEEEGLLVIFLL